MVVICHFCCWTSWCGVTGKKIFFPAGLEKKYCADFLDVGETCKHGENCMFTHAVYPVGFSENDRAIMAKFVDETNGLSFKPKNVSKD